MDHYFDFDQAAIPALDLTDDISSINADVTELEANECFDSLFLDKSASLAANPTTPQSLHNATTELLTEIPTEPDTFILKLINDREVEAVRWKYNYGAEYPMFKAKTPCSLCARMGMDCFLASRGMLITGCTACISLYRDCSFIHPELPRGMMETFPGIAEDEQVCHGPSTQKKPVMSSFSAADQRGRKSGARFHRDAVKILKVWLAEHNDHPYPNERERDELRQLTGLTRSQINNWLANARRRGKARPPSDPASPILGAVDIPKPQNGPIAGYENLNPLDRWKCSPPENEPALMTDIARAVTTTALPSTSLQHSRASSRKASSEEDSSALSVMFQPPSVSSFETRESSNSTFSLASSRSQNSRQSFASSQERRRRRRGPLLQRANQRASGPVTSQKMAKQNKTSAKDRIFQCTFCTDTFPAKFDWQRHEKSLHLALERWTCCPMGNVRIEPTTGSKQCVFCPELDPSEAHLEEHNFQACHEKTVAERTFYRKDHLRQHLRLMHGVKFDPHMDTWKSTTLEVKSRCGFCPSLFTTWAARADHLAAHFKNGADMKDWEGSWGFEPFVERLVENALPPYLIGHERKTMDPYRAREMAPPSTKSRELKKPESSIRDRSVESFSAYDRPEVDQQTKDSNCWHRLEDELVKFAIEKKAANVSVSDKEIQDYARLVIYGDPDPWDWTMADNQIWLQAFKAEHGLISATPSSGGPETPEYASTRAVPVAAPYVIKGGLKSNSRRSPNQSHDRHRSSVSSLPGVQERSCPLSLQSTNSSYTGGTPVTPFEDLPDLTSTQPMDVMQMDLDFDGIDFDQLALNNFVENFEHEMVDPQMSTAYSDVNQLGLSGMGYSNVSNVQHKALAGTPNPFIEDDMPEISLEAFDQLTGYTGNFR